VRYSVTDSPSKTRIHKAGNAFSSFVATVNRLVTDEAALPNRIAVFKEGHNLTGGLSLGRAKGWFEPLLADIMAQGVSVVVNDIPLTQAACDAVEQITDVPSDWVFQQNLYITPREVQGFVPHCDAHIVVVAQLYGSKEWLLYRRMMDNPLILDEGKEGLVADPNEKLAIAERFAVGPGDIFVIPRGRYHAACAQDGASVHIAIGCAGIRPVDVLWALAGSAMERSDLRADMASTEATAAAQKYLRAGGQATFDLPRYPRLAMAIPKDPQSLSFQAVLDAL